MSDGAASRQPLITNDYATFPGGIVDASSTYYPSHDYPPSMPIINNQPRMATSTQGINLYYLLCGKFF